jgi:hypothetical protein
MTNIINTLCSFGTFATGINNVTKGNRELINRTKVIMAGDDVIGKIPISLVDSLSNELLSNSGMIMDDIRDTSGHINSTNPVFRNTFLKKKYSNNGIS